MKIISGKWVYAEWVRVCSRTGFRIQRFDILGLLCFRILKANVVTSDYFKPARICSIDL